MEALQAVLDWNKSKPSYFIDQCHISGDWMFGPNAEPYPRWATISRGDQAFVQYKSSGPSTSCAPIERILNERTVWSGNKRKREYLVKFKGYELPPWKADASQGTEEYGNWIDADDVGEKAVDDWKKQKPLYHLLSPPMDRST